MDTVQPSKMQCSAVQCSAITPLPHSWLIPPSLRSGFTAAFSLIFVSEIGDKVSTNHSTTHRSTHCTTHCTTHLTTQGVDSDLCVRHRHERISFHPSFRETLGQVSSASIHCAEKISMSFFALCHAFIPSHLIQCWNVVFPLLSLLLADLLHCRPARYEAPAVAGEYWY